MRYKYISSQYNYIHKILTLKTFTNMSELLMENIGQIFNSKIFVKKNSFLFMMSTESSRVTELREQLNKRVNNSSTFKIEVHRSNILEDSFKQFQNTNPTNYLNQLEVHFIGEDSTGSLIKEWINLLVDELLDSKKHLFVNTEKSFYYPSAKSGINTNHLDYFRFSGKIFALSIIYDAQIRTSFSSFFLKHILHLPIEQYDIRDYDHMMLISFDNLNRKSIEKADLYFETSIDGPNGRETVELIPNGSNIKVTDANKNEYFEKMTDLLLTKSISEQTKSFCQGFDSIIPHNEIENVTPGELDQLIIGSLHIDVEDLKKRVKVNMPYTLEKPVIKYFFNAISKWDNEKLMKLMFFITGVPNIPKNGDVFTIECGGNPNMLPMAHTVMNVLSLPEYLNEEDLNKKLLTAIEFSSF